MELVIWIKRDLILSLVFILLLMDWILGIIEYKYKYFKFLRSRFVNVFVVERLNFEDFYGEERIKMIIFNR